MAKVINIGIPENDSERKAIAFLSKELPDDFVILTNLELSAPHGLPYEYDMIVIGDKAVYVIETKGYKGEIRGNALEWEFSSGRVQKSPIPLLNKKKKIVADRIHRYSPRLMDVWVESILLLTDDQLKVRLNDPQQDHIMKLPECVKFILADVGRPSINFPDRVEESIASQFRPLKRGKEIGDYKVLETLGRNELFSTVLCEHKLLRPARKYALKIYGLKIYASEEEQSRHRARILRDANMLFNLPAHPSLARAAPPFPWEGDQIVLPTEWVEGPTLRTVLSQGTLDRRRAVRILAQLCDLLVHIHRNDVVHRDICPENIIVPSEGPVMLVNFDCARMEGSDLTTIATRVGREIDERYVAPEVWNDPSCATKASDVFSVGIIVHEVLTGKTPYQSIKDIFSSRRVESSLSSMEPVLDPELDKLLLSICAFQAQDRPTDLVQIKEALEILL